MSEIEGLLKAYSTLLNFAWEENLAKSQRVWYAVYNPAHERRLRLRMPEFAQLAWDAGHTWVEVDMTDGFARWMAAHEYRQAYFENPDDMGSALKDFTRYTIANLRAAMTVPQVDQNTVVAISGLASLYGLASISKIIDDVSADIRGRLLAFFPGRKEGTVYYLLDARAGYNYIGVPILSKE